ncbi:outer membrane protein assembly factor BamB family protein [Sphingomonas nostoxanthinifaciens]|uniref:outer membrane protein assembly factor BamB family protein n=1 Tax=Sphingomonas nostoxanthinifaciens TaxID=2872652 RepID=UPI001CC1CA56|nr:PQQ-binding-like beta-propeller repeat protein [Sphingomonas nostoxanthinifaciens]UAK25831.1 PQQ-binding-like beta-propeller repeat protein [Sphingomonas nostoxanthinifaciens]
MFALSVALLASASCVSTEAARHAPGEVDWASFGGSPAADHYSPLAQIDRSNVGTLAPAWRFETGVGMLQTSPLVVGGTLYGVDVDQSVFALDAATGRLKWRHQAVEHSEQPVRGLAYWTDGKTRRLFSGNGSYLAALDPETGAPAPGFGHEGRIDLREGMGRDPATLPVFLTTPGVIFDDVIITGFRTGETQPAAPGMVRAYDVRTGALRWRFNTIPQPGEPGHETWPADAWKTAGAANNWAGMAVDTKRGIVYVPTGSAVADFYGADRLGDDLYANSLLAIDARTGRLKWHFQAVHHDIWDRDFPSAPVLLTVHRDGRSIDAVAQTTKQGVVYLFDRDTGRPLFPIGERAIPASDVPGEHASPTEPMPTLPAPFARQQLTENDLTTRTPEAHRVALEAFRAANHQGPFTPFRVGQKTIVFPGFDGGAEWGGPAVDRDHGILFVNSNEMAWLAELVRRDAAPAGAGRGAAIYADQCSACHGVDRKGSPPDFPDLTQIASRRTAGEMDAIIRGGRGRMPGFPQIADAARATLIAYLRGEQEPQRADGRQEVLGDPAVDRAPYRFGGYKRFLDPDNYPAIAPPWGTLNAIDLNSGKFLWKVPLGEYPELAARGMTGTGSENYGGPIVTGSGLLIIGATLFDQRLRIFDSRTGRLLWQTTLPYSGMATPVTYSIGGRQYIAIATSNARNPKGTKGSAYVAFALPPGR